MAKVRILFREGDLGAMKIMGEVAVTQTSDLENFDYATTSSPFLGTFTFLNDRTFAILGETDAKKVFDNVPQKAKVNAVANNRMMYANYEEGLTRLAYLRRPPSYTRTSLTIFLTSASRRFQVWW